VERVKPIQRNASAATAGEQETYRPELVTDDEPRYLRRQKPVEIRRKKFSGKTWPFYRRVLVGTVIGGVFVATVGFAARYLLYSPQMLLLKPDQIVAKPPILFPTHPQWSSYATAWTQGHLGRYLLNSLIVTTVIVVGELVTSIAAAYAFAFLDFPFKKTLFIVFLATMMVPLEVTFLTNLNTVVSLGWYNTYFGLTIPFLATGFGAFLIRQAFLGLPGDLRDASKLDGANHWQFLRAVALPVARPAVAALGIFSFFGAFGQYLWPLIVTKDDRLRTVQIGLKFLANSQINNFNVIFAGTVLAALPLFVLLILFEKQLVRGLTAGAVKG